MKKTMLALAAAALLAGASVASAEVSLEITPVGVPNTNAFGLMEGWNGFVVTLVSDTGNIAAVDVSLTGPMHQVWTPDGIGGFNVTPVNVANNSDPANAFNTDSHFLGEASDMLIADAPSESNSGVGSPLATPAKVGKGQDLAGAWGVLGDIQSTSYDLAYLVLESGTTAELGGSVATAGGTFDVGGTVPEPATMSLLALGSLAVLRRRRRK